MKRTTALLTAFALLAPAGHMTSGAFADKKDGTSKEAPAQSGAEDAGKDDGLKSIEGGFSIPAADGASSKAETQKKDAPKK